MKNVKKIVSVLIGSAMTVSPIGILNIAIATEQNAEELGTVNISIKYDTDIAPQIGDTFDITYCREDDEFTQATISFDAAQINAEDGAIFQVPYGSYTILNIDYTGKNEKIRLQGYGVNAGFYCADGVDGHFKLGIGTETVQAMERDYDPGNIRVKDTNHNEWGVASRDVLNEKLEGKENNPVTMEEYEKDQENKKTEKEKTDTEKAPSNIVIESNTNIENTDNDSDVDTEVPDVNAAANSNGEEKVHNYLEEEKQDKDEQKESNKKENKKKDALTKAIGLIVIAICGFTVMFVMHKMGKF